MRNVRVRHEQTVRADHGFAVRCGAAVDRAELANDSARPYDQLTVLTVVLEVLRIVAERCALVHRAVLANRGVLVNDDVRSDACPGADDYARTNNRVRADGRV